MKIEFLLLISFIFFSFIFINPVSALLFDDRGTLSVRVKDCSTNLPISKAKVTVQGVNDPTRYTCILGYTTFHFLPSGRYDVSVSKSGYETESTRARVYSGEKTRIDICLDSYLKDCSISATVSTPSDVCVGDTVYTTVELKNYGDAGGYTDVTAYLCRSDGTDCRVMDCDDGDPRVYIGGKDTEWFGCSIEATQADWHVIKVRYSDCNDGDPTIYSNKFEVRRCYPDYVHWCDIDLVDTEIYDTDIQVGDTLRVSVELRMSFEDYDWDPWAKTTVYVERDDDDSETKYFDFPYSGAKDEKTFSFSTSGWRDGEYNVYVRAVGQDNCDEFSKTHIGSVYVNPDPSDCTARYINSYRCSGRWVQQLYRYSDCGTRWENIEYCSYGCSYGSCIRDDPPVSDPPYYYVSTSSGMAHMGNAIYLDEIEVAKDVNPKPEEMEKAQVFSQTQVSILWGNFLPLVLFLVLIISIPCILLRKPSIGRNQAEECFDKRC